MADAPKPPTPNVPPSSADVDSIEVEFDDPLSVDRLLEITGDSWSIDEQVEVLQEATRSAKPPPLPGAKSAKPGAAADARRPGTRSAGPPPLP
ncbi:MAG TPA: hypothetical protein PLR99_24805, partial [Polyangiaceae bacterium]|nr:hypothetical protein [Polyangiaceae bacterium]